MGAKTQVVKWESDQDTLVTALGRGSDGRHGFNTLNGNEVGQGKSQGAQGEFGRAKGIPGPSEVGRRAHGAWAGRPVKKERSERSILAAEKRGKVVRGEKAGTPGYTRLKSHRSGSKGGGLERD